MTMHRVRSMFRHHVYRGVPAFAISAAMLSLFLINCNSKSNPAAPAATAMTLVSPVGGTQYSFTDTIIVKWIANPDSLGNQPLPSFNREFSLDSGKNWVHMTASPASYIDNGDDVYQETWTGLDTTQVNPVTFQPLTKSDFLNKGVIVHIVSYPPKLVTRQSGYIFFHE
jgi:hypothetical protein